jgi:pyruvate kinase
VVDLPESVEQFLKQSESMAKALHLASSGDRVIVLAGHPIGATGGTKMLIVEEIT